MKLKQIFILLLAVCMLGICPACSKSADAAAEAPSAVVERFAKALTECKLEKAQEDAYGVLNKTLADGAEKYDSPEKKEVWKKNFLRLKDIKIDSEKIDGDSAVVVVTNGSAQTEFSLVNVNGEWKVTGMR